LFIFLNGYLLKVLMSYLIFFRSKCGHLVNIVGSFKMYLTHSLGILFLCNSQ
jgi:hypothetical protein